MVAVEDVTNLMIKLMESNVINERFIIVSENWSYKKFLKALSKAVNSKPPQKMASSFILNLGWKLDWLIHKLTGKRRQLTKQIVHSLSSETFYSSEKIKQTLNYNFKSVQESITSIGIHYQK